MRKVIASFLDGIEDAPALVAGRLDGVDADAGIALAEIRSLKQSPDAN